MHTSRPWTKFAGGGIFVLPIGAIEQHGPALPVDTDLRISCLLAEELEAAMDSIVVLPPLPYSLSWEHRDFPGTLSLSVPTLHAVIRDLLLSLSGWRDFRPRLVVLLSWHGGNQALYSSACELSGSFSIPVIVLPSTRGRQQAYAHAGSRDVHAGWIESSILLAKWPELIDRDQLISCQPQVNRASSQTILEAFGISHFCPDGVWGDARNADPKIGQEILDELIHQMLDEIHTVLSS